MRETFAQNYRTRKEVGAARTVYYRGEKGVELGGGMMNKATGERWGERTRASIASATKGFAATATRLAPSRGRLDSHDCIAKHWPEFAQRGKGTITIR